TRFSRDWSSDVCSSDLFYVKKFLFLSTIFYVLMGWIIIFAWRPLVHALPLPGLVLLIVGGVLYTAGSVFYVWRAFPYHHAVWHEIGRASCRERVQRRVG